MTELPSQAYAAALAGLPFLTPLRQRVLLARLDPAAAWRAACNGIAFPGGVPSHTNSADPVGDLRREALAVDPAVLWDRCIRTNTAVHILGDGTYPAALAADPFAPAVLFSRGRLDALDRRRVAIVGTRQATLVGREIAAELGTELAQHDIGVVSGLASGIDGAAHRGVLAAIDGAPPIGVVGSGLDIPYPRGHAALWECVATSGVLLAEVPPGSRPLGHHFPLRNRIIAALAEVVVVVESRSRGGSLLTVDEALRRECIVMAVPGSPRNPAACGTNELLRDGSLPVHDVGDILMQLGLDRLPFARSADRRVAPNQDDARLLSFLSDAPVSFEQMMSASGADVRTVAAAMARLEMAGWVVEAAGCYERVHAASGEARVR